MKHRPEVTLSILEKLYNALSTNHYQAKYQYASKLSKQLKVPENVIREELAYLKRKGIIFGEGVGQAVLYSLSMRGEIVTSYLFHKIKTPEYWFSPDPELIYDIIDRPKKSEERFIVDLQITHDVAYGKVLAMTKSNVSPKPTLSFTRGIEYLADYGGENEIRLNLGRILPVHNMETVLKHEDGHSVQARVNTDISVANKRPLGEKWDDWEKRMALLDIFEEGFAQLIAGEKPSEGLEFRYTYGHELFDTIRLARGFEEAVGFGLYENPTFENIKKAYLDSCEALNRQPRMRLDEAVLKVYKQQRY
jgi:hypothetical protein